MKAVVFHQHGGLDVLEYVDFPTPEPKPGEALVRLHAAALNRVDVFVRNGWPGLKLELPHIPGADGAGKVVALNSPHPHPLSQSERGAEGGLRAGDHVVINANLGCGQCEYCLDSKDNMCNEWHLLGETIRGTYAECVCVPIRQLYKLPDDFDLHQAAASALVYQTAWHSLIYLTARRIDSGAKDFAKYSAMSKALASDVAMKVTTDAVQVFGGYGYMKDYPVEKMMRDAKITQIYEGTNQIQRGVIARQLVKEMAGTL